MNLSSASQALSSDTLKFTNPDGTSICVFAEAGEIQDRPLLMRRLKKYGATITSEPREAQIILVDPGTDSGRRFIRDWGQDTNKVVLSSGWVKKSIEAGYPLFQNEQWGGCLAIDDGLPIGTEDEEDENVPKRCLPTPRTTPVDATQPVFQPVPQTSAWQQASGLPINMGTGASTPSLPGTLPFVPSPFNFGMNFPNPMLDPQAQQAMLLSIFGASLGPAIAQNFNIALQDIISRTPADASTAVNSPLSASAAGPSIPSVLQTRAPEQRRVSSKRSRSPEDPTSASPSPEPPKTRKDKQRAISSDSPSRPLLFTKASGEPSAFYVQIEIPQRQDLINAIKKNGGKLEQNHELADYIILHKRTAAAKSSKTLIQSIHAAGKMALSSRFVRDCIERNSIVRKADYELEPPHPRKRKKVSNVTPKIEEGAASDVERARKREEQKLARQQRLERKQQEEENAAANPVPPPKPKPEPVADAPLKPKKPTMRPENTSVSTKYPPPPAAPPGVHTRVPMARGFRFSEEEDNYALKCAKLLIDHDHTVSTSAICSYIHKLLPHHTLKSWRTHFANLQPDEVERWRKRSGIAFRKAQSTSNASHQVVENEVAYTPPPFVDSPMPMSELGDQSVQITHTSAFTAEDIERHKDIVAQFFADGNDDDQEVPPSVLWQRLAALIPVRTGSGWEDFYNENYEEITAKYTALVDTGS